ncbi:ATPase [Brachyspira hampsonii]|uniref:ATPase n=1 Tax=Brachyspira hampsonii TaxID=1287055 RepID=A0A1E5NF53_9SPIR|nr:ATP-binding protein [Brachyspira hampsonii]OEJ14810.1 ATPase [Brachyspira hampsonii]
MLKNISIKNFRGFDKLKINNLNKINLLVGQNNCGKTSILEAIAIISGMPDCSIAYHINSIRRINENSELKNLFYNFDYKNNNIEFDYQFDNVNHNLIISPILRKDILFENKTDELNELEYKLNIELENKIEEYKYIFRNGSIRKTIKKIGTKEYINNISELYLYNVVECRDLLDSLANIIKNKDEELLINLLSFFNKKIKSIKIIKNDIYLDIEEMNELILLNLMGDGLKKYLSIIIPMVVNQYNMILIDEIENGLHYKSIKHLLRSILSLIRSNSSMQIFFTTHSYEVLKFLSEISDKEFNDMKDMINIINIVNTENKGFQSYNYNIDGVKELLENDSDIRY